MSSKMMKKYLFNCMALLALVLFFGSCSRETEWTSADSLVHAESVLGVKIDPTQDWKMTSTATANVTVNKLLGEQYTVKVYTNNPMVDDVAYVLAKGVVTSGETFNKSFSYASALTSLYVGVTDKHGFTLCKRVDIENGMVTASFVDETAAAPSRRSQTAPEVAEISAPYDEAWVAEYLKTAKEPTQNNIWDSHDDSYMSSGNGGSYGGFNWLNTAGAYLNNWYPISDTDAQWFEENCRTLASWNNWNTNDAASINTYYDLFYEVYNKCQDTGRGDWMNVYSWPQKPTDGQWVTDENYVLNFKITGTWVGGIGVLATEGLTNGVANGCERTVVVTGTWTLNADQKVGSLGKIIVAKGGTLNITDGKTLTMVNQSRLVVLSGGVVQYGNIIVSNGNESGRENYNGGTIDVFNFNNNFGKFYNYGTFKADVYAAGSLESNFYNHGKVVIGSTKQWGNYVSSNARIFNNCQWYCTGDMRARNYEGTMGSALLVDGELMFSGSEDGTSDPSYVGLAAGALVQCGTLNNNGTSWTGPTSGYAVLSMGKITYLNWQQDHPEQGGYFEGNIYVHADEWNNVPDGNGYHQTDPSDADNYKVSIASYKFFNIVANCTEKVGVTKIKKDSNGEELIGESEEGFIVGEKGCTPGFKGSPDTGEEENQIFSYAFEDSWNADYDMNDVVVKVQEDEDNPNNIKFTLCCTGAAYNLYVYYGNSNGDEEGILFGGEVHAAFGANAGTFVNTGSGDNFVTSDPVTMSVPKKDENLGLGDLNLYVKSPEKEKISVASEGQDPHAVVIPLDWKWPTEWTSIKLAYPEFVDFAADKSCNNEWYNNPTSEGYDGAGNWKTFIYE